MQKYKKKGRIKIKANIWEDTPNKKQLELEEEND